MFLRLAAVAIVAAAITALIAALLMNVAERKREGQARFVRLVEVDEETEDPALWGRNFPREYDGYKRTVDIARTRYGGSEAIQKLDADPLLRRIFAGYPFALDYREERGHAYMLSDQEHSRRVTDAPEPGTCLHCHSAVMNAYRKLGDGDVWKGFDALNAMTWSEARRHVTYPVTCGDCHDPKSMQLRITRPGFLNGIRALKASQGIPNYDPNREATRQEMRSYVCGQCHVEYYFKGEGKTLTYPWARGLRVEDIEAYYDAESFKDWTHAETGAAVLKAQHPEFEMWNQGIHARSGVACADCHMPYVRQGAMKVSDHHVRSPLLNVANACQTCHRYPEPEILARVEAIQSRTKGLLDRSERALVDLIEAVAQARKAGVREGSLAAAQALQRKAQWRTDFVAAENSMGFHAPQEAARILGEAIDYARQGELSALRAAHSSRN